MAYDLVIKKKKGQMVPLDDTSQAVLYSPPLLNDDLRNYLETVVPSATWCINHVAM